MADLYYSTQPFLAWCLNHHIYNQAHYAYVARPFYPYRLPNPKSSNPYLIFQDLYQPWKDNDDTDKFVSSNRLGLKKGVEVNYTKGVINQNQRNDLRYICDHVEVLFFYPVVYRVDVEILTPKERLRSTAWRERGSAEYLVEDLMEDEFDLYFLDYHDDAEFNRLNIETLSADEAISILRSRC